MSSRPFRASALSGTSLLALAAMAMSLSAFPSAAADAVTEDDGMTIVVTGSHIKTASGETSDSPVATVKAEELRQSGLVNASDMLNRLPQFTGDQSNAFATYGTPGTATLDLRGLGAARTMVLLDGKRLMPGDPAYPYPDIDFIPSALIDSIDVVTGGASAVYGSDAIAGVVNFKMKRDFQGIQVDQTFSAAQHDNHDGAAQTALRNYGLTVPGDRLDAFTNSTTITAGYDTDDRKGNVTFYVGHAGADPVTDAERDFAACGIATVNNSSHACSGSGNNSWGRFRLNGTGTSYSINPNGQANFVPYTSSMAYDSQTDADLQREDERYNGGLFAHYEIAPELDVYVDSMAMYDQTRIQFSPSGVYSGHNYTINCDNPLLSATEAKTLCGANAGSPTANWVGSVSNRFSSENVPRFNTVRHVDFRETLGARGDIGDGWSYDVSALYSRVNYDNTLTNDVSIAKAQNSLLVKNVNGVPTCVSAINGSDPTCAPLNIFQLGQVTNAALNYVLEPSYERGNVTEKMVSGTLNGDLGRWGIQSPWAEAPVAVAFGTEWRDDSISMAYSQDLLIGDLASTASSPVHPTHGSTDDTELYTEIRLPLVQNKEWIKELALDAGYRWSHYNLAGDTDTYKGGVTYAPTADFTLRAGGNHAVRAPSVVELFTPDMVTSASGSDPCAGTNPTASLAACERSGVTPAQYKNIVDCSSGFCNAETGGNTALKPETADTYTFGVVLNPSFAKEFTASVDYYAIDVKNVIGVLPPTLAFSQCLTAANPFYCGFFHRNGQGTLAGQGGYIVDTNTNLGYLRTAGLDFAAKYRFDLAKLGLEDLGALAFSFSGTWTEKRRIDPAPGQPDYDCAGLYGPTCGVPTPTWRHSLRTSWQTPWDAEISLNWRFIQGSGLDFDSAQPTLRAAANGAYDSIDARIPAYSYFDLTMAKTFEERYTLRLGVNNLFDKDPPVVDTLTYPVASTFSNANTYPGLYDTLGRVIFMSISAKFF